MIKLKQLLTEARFDIGYHAAPGRIMGSINKHGLNPKLSKYYSSDEIYFFRDKTEAHSYAVHVAHYDKYEPFYILQVDLKGIDLKKDMGLHPGSDLEVEDSAFYTNKPIPANKLKVIDKV
jgi:hypothetical protein